MSREVCGICWCPFDEFTGECACAPEPEAPPQRTPEECIDILLQRMNISELAQAIGVDASAISHVKAGRSRITHYEKVDKLRSMV